MRRYISELIGSFIFILIGCGSRVFGGNQVGVLAEAIAFGFTFIAMVYAIGNISGGHINPAVSLAMYMTNKLSLRDFFYYILSQFIGGILAIAILVSMINLSGEIETVKQIGLAQNGYAEASSIGISFLGALLIEFILTFVYIIATLGVLAYDKTSHLGGIVIGFTLIGIYIIDIPLTGGGINPARSLAPAVFLGGTALRQVWLFIIAPFAGAAGASVFWNFITKELTL
ncbi:MAG: aquaporin [Clostridium sp.]|nr:aquaporin [Clostridium sp.]